MNKSEIRKKLLKARKLNKNKSNLNKENIFVFGIKPKSPTSDYGYFLTKKKSRSKKEWVERPFK